MYEKCFQYEFIVEMTKNGYLNQCAGYSLVEATVFFWHEIQEIIWDKHDINMIETSMISMHDLKFHWNIIFPFVYEKNQL